MTEHNHCGTDKCCGNCEGAGNPLSDALDEIEAQSVRELLPAGAEAMWDHIAADSPQYIAPWDDQDDKARQVFTAAFEVGLATMAAIADGADDR